MSCTTIKVTVIGSPSGVLAIMDAANQAVKDAESARDESFLSRDAAKASSDASAASASAAATSAAEAAQSVLNAKESETKAQGYADDAQTSMVGAKGAMAQAKVYRDQAREFAGQKNPIEIKKDGASVGIGVSEMNFVGDGVKVEKTANGAYSFTFSTATASISWASITGKPLKFDPTARTHAISEITGLQNELDGKQAKGEYALASELSNKVDKSIYNAEKSNFAKKDEANTFAKNAVFAEGVTLNANSTILTDGTLDEQIPNIRVVKSLIAQQAKVQTDKDDAMNARIVALEDEEATSINVTANDAAKTITIKLISNGKTISSGTIDISGMFASAPDPVPTAHKIYFGFSVSGSPNEAEVKAETSRDVTNIDGEALDFVRSDKTPAYLFAWIPDDLGAVRGFSSGGFVDNWQSSVLSVDGKQGLLYVSDNQTATDNITFEVKK